VSGRPAEAARWPCCCAWKVPRQRVGQCACAACVKACLGGGRVPGQAAGLAAGRLPRAAGLAAGRVPRAAGLAAGRPAAVRPAAPAALPGAWPARTVRGAADRGPPVHAEAQQAAAERPALCAAPANGCPLCALSIHCRSSASPSCLPRHRALHTLPSRMQSVPQVVIRLASRAAPGEQQHMPTRRQAPCPADTRLTPTLPTCAKAAAKLMAGSGKVRWG